MVGAVNPPAVHTHWPLTAALLVALAVPVPVAALLVGAPDGPEADTPDRRLDLAGERSPWSGIGATVVNGNVYGGVLIADRYVLTAGHVVAGVDPATISFALPRRTDAPVRCTVDAIYIHPAFRGYSPQRPHGDIAVVRLAQPAPQWARRYRLAEQAPLPGSVITLVGFGTSTDGYGGGGVPTSPALRRAGDNVVDALLVPPGADQPAVFVYDFDGPDGDGASGGPTLGNRIETMVGPGDSGGPVLAPDGATVLGVSTFRMATPAGPEGRFGSAGGGVLVAPYAPWIRAVLAGEVEAQALSAPSASAR